jgi:SM-20-related protein
MQLQLNPALDVEKYARLFRENGRVQVPELFAPAIAEQIERVLQQLPYRVVLQNDAEENMLLTRDDLVAMPPEDRRKLEAGIRERAARSVGYTYHMYPMILARLQSWDPGHPIHALTDFMNSPAFLSFARQLIGFAGLTKIDVHASQYLAGHYLTTHTDDDATQHGRAAYTIGFSRDWRADWGGLLVFLDENGDIEQGFIPRFNTLTVFNGMQRHTVTAISSFTPKPRLSLAGWFRDDPPVARR